MLENMKKILDQAKKNKYAVPQFNINNLEWTKYILEEVNKLESPVILGVSESTIKYMGGYKTVVNLVEGLIEDLKIKVPVALHLDHGSTIENIKEALEAGFKSVMIDASSHQFDENIRITKEVVEISKKYGVTVEGEIGSIGLNNEKIIYTNVEDALKFVKETKVDVLAPAVGSVHGIYKEIPQINYKLIKEINEKIDIPLVLHGASGLSNETLKKTIECGICKININTDLQIAWSNELKKYLNHNKEIYDPRKIISSGEEEIKRVIDKKLKVLKSIGVAKIDK